MSRIYVASSWRNPDQPEIVRLLRAEGHEVYDFRNPPNGVPGFAWSEIDPDWQGWSARRYRELLTTHPTAALGFLNDLRGMQWADACVMVLPCGRSAHLEAGWFCGQGKRCIILTQDGEEPELMALLATDICVSVEEVLTVLRGHGRFRKGELSRALGSLYAPVEAEPMAERQDQSGSEAALSPAQIDLARHALGLPNVRRQSYRNRFLAGGPHPEWQAMEAAGLAESAPPDKRGMTWFWLTRAGAEAALKRGERLCPEDFPPVTAAAGA